MPNISMRNFMRLVEGAHGSFRQSTSSLNNIIILLGGNAQNSVDVRNINNRTALNIESEVHQLPVDKLHRYRTALVYLGNTLNIDSYARPTNYQMGFVGFELQWYQFRHQTHGMIRIDNARYMFKHQFTFESTNGDNSTFSHCLTREHVWYPTARAYDPPFNQLLGRVPQSFVQPPNGSQGTVIGDDHSTFNPDYIVRRPLTMGRTIEIRQRYQYLQPGRQWTDIPGASYILKKGVRWGAGGDPCFFFSKENYAPENSQAFHFEVEIALGNAPLGTFNRLPSRGAFSHDSINRQREIRVIADGS
ncbi:hypothetical protein PCIT_a0095 [Pseudoalteromonas citrea]|uniref:Uncharacterized protein n=2 Tax=Pseudoalteromonas citrea TaxID=43655 RepID=A0AAD4AK40_9GAMM|nr:hypothetical protein [Pseudoalteromonas citrea]KAF7773776.1 hypothetical protein PCIT_a0095 [Pseudoalteromonas citrea]